MCRGLVIWAGGLSIVATGVEAVRVVVLVVVVVVVVGMEFIKPVMTLIPSSNRWSHATGGAGGLESEG